MLSVRFISGHTVERIKLAFDELFLRKGKVLSILHARSGSRRSCELSQPAFFVCSHAAISLDRVTCTVLCLNGAHGTLPFLLPTPPPRPGINGKRHFPTCSAVLDIVWDITHLVIAISISTGDEFSGEAWITAVFGVAIPAIGAAKVIHELVS